MSVLNPFVKVGLLFALFFLPMVLEAYVFGKHLKGEPLGTFMKYIFLSTILTVCNEFCEWYSMRYGPCTFKGFKMITKLCLDIPIVILLILGIIGLFVKMGNNINIGLSGSSVFVLLLSIAWKLVFQTSTPQELENSPTRAHSGNVSGSSLSFSVTPQTPQESQLQNGNMGINTDNNENDGRETDNEEQTVDRNLIANSSPENGSSEANALNSPAREIDIEAQTINGNPVTNISPEDEFSVENAINSPACKIGIEAQPINGNPVANISPEDDFSEPIAQEHSGLEIDLEAQSTMEYQSPCARIYKWVIMLGDGLGVWDS